MSMAEMAASSLRPTVMGRHHAVACGHYLATEAAMRVLAGGGNAVDAGVTAALALAVLQPDIVSFAGVAPTLIYSAAERRVASIAGLGYWPAATDIARLAREGGGAVPAGLLRTVIPAAPAAHIAALSRFGTLSFEAAATPALVLAREGFPMYPFLAQNIESHAAEYDRFAENARIFRPGGRSPQVGQLFLQADLAHTIERLIDAERAAAGGRERKLRAVHECFYHGPIAAAIATYHAAHGGFVTRADLASFEAPVEESLQVRYRGYDVHSCDVWCQGVVLLEALHILDGTGGSAQGHNSAAYVHQVAEALNLAFADREAWIGDPRFVAVPRAGLLSADYARAQRARIDPRRAFGGMPAPGEPAGAPPGGPSGGAGGAPEPGAPRPAPDTIYCAVVDDDGNAYSVTPSDTSFDTPIIPGTGLAVSSRGSQSRLLPEHPNAVAAGKRPRLTPTPGLALAGDDVYLAFGTPGGDVQCQAMLQVWLNILEFGMSVQNAIEAPRFATFSFPNSFAPHEYLPGRLCLEVGIAEQAARALADLGHDVQRWPRLTPAAGGVCAILRDPVTGLLHAGADPRREAYAAAW